LAETDQVREFRDGLLDHLGRVHGDISELLERTRKHRDETTGLDGVARRPAEPAAEPTDAGKAAEPVQLGEPPKLDEPSKPDEPAKLGDPPKVQEPR
jgi:hypothetical protein